MKTAVSLALLALAGVPGDAWAQVVFVDGFESADASQWSDLSGANVFVLPFGGAEKSGVVRFTPRVRRADLFFLLDTTGSMGGERGNLQSGLPTIIAETSTRVDDPAFGVGSFEDFPVAPYGSPALGDLPFRLLQGITTDTAAASAGVAGLTLRGGGDTPESGYEALFQVADGTGVFGTGGSFGPFTTAGRIGGGQFRSGSLPVIVHITDAPAHDDYPSGFNHHGKVEALAALTAIGARAVTVQSSTQPDATISAELEEISATTSAVVPVCAFKTGATTWQCGVDQCCDGTVPSAGDCVLRYRIGNDGSGLADAVVSGSSAVVKYGAMGVFAEGRDDGSATTPDTGALLVRVEANVADDSFRPAAEPERSCVPLPTRSSFQGAGHDNGYVDFRSGARPGATGARLYFTVVVQNGSVPSSGDRQYLTTPVDVIDAATGAVLDTLVLILLVP